LAIALSVFLWFIASDYPLWYLQTSLIRHWIIIEITVIYFTICRH
jgi:hypothetical protein